MYKVIDVKGEREIVLLKGAKDNSVLLKKNYYYILNILIAIIPKIYEKMLIPWFGEALKLQTKTDGVLVSTDLGIFIERFLNILVVVFIIWYNIASARKGTIINKSEIDKLINEREGLNGANQLLRKILHSTYKTCSSKYDTLLSKIKEIDSKTSQRPIKIVSDPCKQLKSIIENMVSCVANVTNVEESSLRTRVAYRLKGGNWEQITGYSSDGYFSIENLTKTTNTTFNCITRTDSNRESFIFFNKKSIAAKAGKYVFEPYRDFDGETIKEDTVISDGSILAKSLFVGDNCSNMFAEMVIFIDTTDDCFFTKDDTKDNIRSVKKLLKHEIFKTFEERLKIELALMYIGCFERNK